MTQFIEQVSMPIVLLVLTPWMQETLHNGKGESLREEETTTGEEGEIKRSKERRMEELLVMPRARW